MYSIYNNKKGVEGSYMVWINKKEIWGEERKRKDFDDQTSEMTRNLSWFAQGKEYRVREVSNICAVRVLKTKQKE